MFSSHLYLNILHGTTCTTLCVWHVSQRLSLVYSPIQWKHSAPISKFSSSLSKIMGSTQSLESKDDDSVHLTFTTNYWNICVTGSGLSVLLQPYFVERFLLISSLFPFLVFLKFVFVWQAHPNSSSPFRECSCFVGSSWFLPTLPGTGLISEDRTITVVFSEAGGVKSVSSVDLCC